MLFKVEVLYFIRRKSLDSESVIHVYVENNVWDLSYNYGT